MNIKYSLCQGFTACKRDGGLLPRHSTPHPAYIVRPSFPSTPSQQQRRPPAVQKRSRVAVCYAGSSGGSSSKFAVTSLCTHMRTHTHTHTYTHIHSHAHTHTCTHTHSHAHTHTHTHTQSHTHTHTCTHTYTHTHTHTHTQTHTHTHTHAHITQSPISQALYLTFVSYFLSHKPHNMTRATKKG